MHYIVNHGKTIWVLEWKEQCALNDDPVWDTAIPLLADVAASRCMCVTITEWSLSVRRATCAVNNDDVGSSFYWVLFL